MDNNQWREAQIKRRETEERELQQILLSLFLRAVDDGNTKSEVQFALQFVLARQLRDTFTSAYNALANQYGLQKASAAEIKRMADNYAEGRIEAYGESIAGHSLDNPDEAARATAVTEIWSAGSAGEVAAAGSRLVGYWQTSGDEAVCPICEPLDGLPIKEIGFEPSAHVSCRCWIEWRTNTKD